MKRSAAIYSGVLSFILALAAGCAAPPGQQGLSERDYTIQWDDSVIHTGRGAGYLSTAEKRILAEINKVRVNPKGYALNYIKGSEHCKSACEPIAARISRVSPMAPLLPSRELHLAAKAYVDGAQTGGGVGYSGKTGAPFRDRIERYAEWKGFIAESISYGEMKPTEIVVNFLVRENSDQKAGSNLLNPNFQFAGVSLGLHKTYRYVCVVDFATQVDVRTHRIQNP